MKPGGIMMERNPQKVYGKDSYGRARLNRDLPRGTMDWMQAVSAGEFSRTANSDGTGGQVPVNPRDVTINPRHRARTRQDADIEHSGEANPYVRAQGREDARLRGFGRSGDDRNRWEIKAIGKAREAGTAGPGWNYSDSDEKSFYRHLDEIDRQLSVFPL
jgi:hypothetical protein